MIVRMVAPINELRKAAHNPGDKSLWTEQYVQSHGVVLDAAQLPVLGEHPCPSDPQHRQEHNQGCRRRCDPLTVTVADDFVNVVSNRFVFKLLKSMPLPYLYHLRVGQTLKRLVFQ